MTMLTFDYGGWRKGKTTVSRHNLETQGTRETAEVCMAQLCFSQTILNYLMREMGRQKVCNILQSTDWQVMSWWGQGLLWSLRLNAGLKGKDISTSNSLPAQTPKKQTATLAGYPLILCNRQVRSNLGLCWKWGGTKCQEQLEKPNVKFSSHPCKHSRC